MLGWDLFSSYSVAVSLDEENQRTFFIQATQQGNYSSYACCSGDFFAGLL